MKKMLAVAAVAALISAPAFAAPEPYSVEIGSNGQMMASPPSANAGASVQMQAQPSQATWTPAAAPGRPSASAAGEGSAHVMKTSSEEGAPAPKKKKHHKKKGPAAPGSEAPKAAPAPGAPAGQGPQ